MKNSLWMVAVSVVLGGLIVGCGNSGAGSEAGDKGAAGGTATKVSGAVNIDGSTTVYPILTAMVSEFTGAQPEVRVSAGNAGTGSGFKKFFRGEVDIATASRAIEQEEIDAAKAANVEFVEIPIAYDGLSIVVSKQNDFLQSITVDELKKVWGPGSTIKTWNEIRPDLPNNPIVLYGPTSNHGTFDYFTEAINGKRGASRTDFQQITDYNALIQGVAGDAGSFGYIGYSYVQQNLDKVRAIPVDAGNGPVEATPETIENGTYTPLSRPLFLYVNKKALDEKPQVRAFVEFVLGEGRKLIAEQNFIPLPDEVYTLVQARLAAGTAGTVFRGAPAGKTMKEILETSK